MLRTFVLTAFIGIGFASFGAESLTAQASSETAGIRWQLEPGPSCSPLIGSDLQFFKRCHLGMLRLEIPQGFVMAETLIRAVYESQLPEAGQQASAILYTEIEDEELRSFATQARTDDPEAMDRHELIVDLALPQINACQDKVVLELPVSTSFFLKRGNGPDPQISFQSLEVVAKQALAKETCLIGAGN